MKILKRINLTILAIVLGFGLVVTQSAFKAAPKTNTYWVFDSNDINNAMDAGSYHLDAEAPGCTAGEELPCRIETPVSVDDEGKFQTYLDNNYVTPSDILNDPNVEKRD